MTRILIQRPATGAWFCGVDSYEGIARMKWRMDSGKGWDFETTDEAREFIKNHNLPKNLRVVTLEDEE